MKQHTPGPWVVIPPDKHHPSRAMVAASKDPHGAGYATDIYDAPLTNETLANARLIAAAPTTITNLERLLDAAKCYQYNLTDDNYHSLGKAILAADEHLTAIKETQ